MPTFNDPHADAQEASQALRGLAHATRSFEDPGETYTTIGELLSGVRSLRQVADQLSEAHLRHRALAHDDEGNHLNGAHAALAAADELHQAGTLLNEVQARLDAASQHSGRIAWHPHAEHNPATHEAGRTAEPRWIEVGVVDGEVAEDYAVMIDALGPETAISHLAIAIDEGDNTVEAAMENGYVYDTLPGADSQRMFTVEEYAISYNESRTEVALYRAIPAPEDPLPAEPVPARNDLSHTSVGDRGLPSADGLLATGAATGCSSAAGVAAGASYAGRAGARQGISQDATGRLAGATKQQGAEAHRDWFAAPPRSTGNSTGRGLSR